MKRVQAAVDECMGPLQWGDNDLLFLEMESEDGAEARMETVGSEIPGTETTKLTEALQVQMAMMQGQVHIHRGTIVYPDGVTVNLPQPALLHTVGAA